MIGQALAHYRITAAIGAGGMGEVYRATDTRLGRTVALKVLPADMARDPERLERFQREARAVAALNHPHIVTLHSVEEADGVHFLTMELVEGQPLDRVIPKGGLPVDRLLAIASAIADALSAAHGKGIVHRDLKPANVMVAADGRVKVLDFGLAKFADEGARAEADAATALQTRDGVVMGTVPYMSPEQIAGRPVDHRTDIFSLGVILYEMAGGQRPFRGTSSAELASAILRDTPPSICQVRADLPQNLGRVIERCLEKSAADRFVSSRDLADRLRGVTADAPVASTGQPTDSRAVAKADSGAARADEGFWVAVLPIKYRGTDADLMALAEGLSEDIVTGLSRFSYLRVIARGATSRYVNEAVDVRTVGKEIGARYLMEGTLRQAGSVLRLAVQLVDTSSGAHLWAETYNRPFRPEVIFELQDDLVPRIVSTVADWYGVLPHTMSESVRNKPASELSPYETVLRGFGYYERVTPEEHAVVTAGLERAVQQAPGYADAWAMLSMMYGEEHRFRFNVQPDPLGRALQAARRAADAAPSSHFVQLALAQALFFRKELPAFRTAAERAIALNPMDGSTCEYVGHLMAFGGDWEGGCDVAEKARQLNPHHPGWYWALPFYDAYRKGDYRSAETFALKMNMAGMDLYHVMLAALYGQLGEREAADRELEQLRAVTPDYALIGRGELAKWYPPDLVEQLIEGLRKAGLEIAPPEATAARAASGSGAARQNEGFWVAVLPFKYAGANADLAALAEGLSEEIVTGLSRFSYLRVIARSSTLRYASETADVREVGKELGARYVIEGSLRQAGSLLRVATQLVDAISGAHLWAETYDRPFRSDEIFALQDDLAPRIVSTVADMQGVLPYSMSETLRNRPADELSPYEALLRSFGFLRRITADEHAVVRDILERATQKAPSHADCWAMLAAMYTNEYIHGFNALPDPLGRALPAARHAVEAAPSNHFAHYALAEVLFYRREIQPFRNAAERAIVLNRMDGYSTAYMGMLLAFAGEWERGCGLVGRGMQLNPNHPKWLWIPLWVNLYRTRDYLSSLDAAHKIDVPHHWYPPTARAATYGQIGDREAGQKAVQELRTLKPDFAERARQEFGKWHEAELVEHLIDGLRKAGLAVA